MHQQFDNIDVITGGHNGGFYKIEIAPREWLDDDIEIDFTTGTVVKEVLLKPGKQLLLLRLIPETYKYDEKPQSAKGGTFITTTVTGTNNDLSPSTLLTLTTFRYSEFIAIVTDKNQRKRIVGNENIGMQFSFTNDNTNASGGNNATGISLTIQTEDSPPFYNTDIVINNQG